MPARIVVYSDMHWGDAWLSECQAAAADLYDLVQDASPDAVVNLGDTFHAKDSISSRTLDAFATSMGRLRGGPPHFVLSGNHDANDRAGEVTSARLFEMIGAQVITGSAVVDIAGVPFGVLSHTSDAQAMRESASRIAADLVSRGGTTVLSHVPIQGVAFNAQSVEESAHALSENDLAAGVRHVISGHYHHPQHRSRVVVCGSPSYLTWGDSVWYESGRAIPRGFLLLCSTPAGLSYERVATARTTVRLTLQTRNINPLNPMSTVHTHITAVRAVHPSNTIIVRIASDADDRKPVEAILEKLRAQAEMTPNVVYTATTSGRLSLPGVAQIKPAAVEVRPLLRDVVSRLDRTVEERAKILARAEHFLPQVEAP